jgi:lauroyl/myristoyl acyltransferase
MSVMGDSLKLFGYALCRLIPIDWVSALGARQGRYRKQKQIELNFRVKHNLELLGLSDQASTIMPALQKQAGRAALEILVSDKIVKHGCIKWQPHAGLDAVTQANRPLVFVTIHMANLGDLVGAKLSAQLPNHTIICITRFISSTIERWVIKNCRQKTRGSSLSWLESRNSNLARKVLYALHHPPSLVLLHIDEAKHHQIHFPTFGRPLPKESNLRYAIRFAQLSGACLVPILLTRSQPDALQFELHVLNVFDLAKPVSTEMLINQVDTLFTQAVKQTPEQWLSLYHLRL